MNPLSPYLYLYLSSLSLSPLSISPTLPCCPGSSPIPTIRVDTTADTFLEVDDNCFRKKFVSLPLNFLIPLIPLIPLAVTLRSGEIRYNEHSKQEVSQ